MQTYGEITRWYQFGGIRGIAKSCGNVESGGDISGAIQAVVAVYSKR